MRGPTPLGTAVPSAGGSGALVVALLIVATVGPATVAGAGPAVPGAGPPDGAAGAGSHGPDRPSTTAASLPAVDPSDGTTEGNESAGSTDGSGGSTAGDHPQVADGLFAGTGDRRASTVTTGLAAIPAAGSTATTATDPRDGRRVVVETTPEAVEGVAAAVRARGPVHLRTDRSVLATLGPAAVRAIADRPDVAFVRAPYRVTASDLPGRAGDLGSDRAVAVDAAGLAAVAGGRAIRSPGQARTPTVGAPGPVVGEGVATIGADRARAAGYTGENVTVAVIDTGFDPDHPEIADNVVRTHDVAGGSVDDGRTAHGTAVAEVVTDVAPDVDLILVRVRTYVGLVRALDWVRNETDADVATMSLGLPGGAPLNGSARADRAVDRVVRAGTPVTVAAGNEGAGSHWNGTWRDADGDDWLEFAGDDERLGVEGPVRVRLQWNDWPAASADYDLYLFDEDGEVVDRSATVQNGTQAPVERLLHLGGDNYTLRVKRVDADGTHRFDAFLSSSGRPEHWTAASSLTVPATARRATAVGAVSVGNLTVEPFSSRGPTVDGRRKPAVVAPDRVTTATYESFPGTSAAAPHVAGAAALLLDADPTLSPAAVVDRLEGGADDLGRSVPDATVGSGLVNVTRSVRPPDPLEARATRLANGSVAVAVRFPTGVAGRLRLRVENRSGGAVAVERAVAGAGAGDGGDGGAGGSGADGADGTGDETVRTVVDASRLAPLGDGPLTVRAAVVDPLGNRNPAGYAAPATVPGSVTPVVELSPTTRRVPVGETTTYEVVAAPDRGLSSYRIEVTAGGPNASVVDATTLAGYGSVDVSNGSATAAAVGLSVPPGERRTLARVTVRGDRAGRAALGLSVASLYDANDTAYRAAPATGGTAVVGETGVDVDGSGDRSTDTDGDGRHEDVDGDGEFSTADVQTLLDDLVGDRRTAGNPAYDFDGDGAVDTGDVGALLDELVGADG